MTELQKAYWNGPDMRERMIPGSLQPDANGHYRWDAREACRRCGGQGGSRHWPGFTCFECGGACRCYYPHEAVTEDRAIALRDALIKRQAKAEARFVKRIAAADVQLLPLCGLGWQQLKDLAHWLRDEIAIDVLWKMAHGKAKAPKPLSEKQLALLVRLPDAPAKMVAAAEEREARMADEEARLVTLPAGRQLLRGRFVNGKVRYSEFGSTVKGLFVAELENDGLAKVWMSIPRGHYRLDGDDNVTVDKDELVALKVTLEPGNDKGFHFGSRPKLEAPRHVG